MVPEYSESINLSTDEIQPEEIQPIKAEDDPGRLAQVYLDRHHSHEDGTTLKYWRGEFHAWTGTHYKPISASEVSARVNRCTEAEFNRLNIEAQIRAEDEEPVKPCRKVTRTLVNNVVGALDLNQAFPDR